MAMRLRVITNSELTTSRRCFREHQYAYELGFRPITKEHALAFGTLIHTALEAWWRAAAVSDNRLTSALATLPLDIDPFELARATVMIEGYDARWKDEPFEVVAVEAEFRAPLIHPDSGQASRVYLLGGKIDVLVIDRRDGQLYIIEHKTSSDDISSGSIYWQALRLNTQVSTYYAGARALGYAPAGVIYDVLGKFKHEPLLATPFDKRTYRKKDGALHASQRVEDETPDAYADRLRAAVAEVPDRYFVRGTVVRLESEEVDAQWDAWQQSIAIRNNTLMERWPRNPDGCVRYHRLCSYFGVCTGAESITDPALFRHVSDPHEELSADFGKPQPKQAARITH